jgi:NAD(P)H-nitrite reductase large subunit
MFACKHLYDPFTGGWIPYFNEQMQTDRTGIFVAGDGAGVAGVLVARCEGMIAGLYAAVHAGIISKKQAEQSALISRKKLSSLRKFRHTLDRVYPIPSSLYGNITDDTLVCRCEGVTAGTIRQAIKDGTTDFNDIKKRTRAGMGYCQGTNCLPTIAAIIAREFGLKEKDIGLMTTRPPAKPIPLNLLMVDLEGD